MAVLRAMEIIISYLIQARRIHAVYVKQRSMERLFILIMSREGFPDPLSQYPIKIPIGKSIPSALKTSFDHQNFVLMDLVILIFALVNSQS